MNTLLVVAAALINDKGEVLLAERPAHKTLPGHLEFPGGKIEPNETPEAALVRELKEELGITVRVEDMEPLWFLSHSYPEFDFHLMMPVWTLTHWQGEPKALEHAAILWSRPEEMKNLKILEADYPLVDRLTTYIETSQ